ncbi:hypothetical protein DFH08DRAFT_949941 [Mycena albidolilacea]|uniref:Uncharacterized protein n=1 Tax=Mycena albidolilacea TaxID=1033008 RepID=A0AAD7AP17_9AGAR|nr:hypothetical protein DFH08DRAFT_949941 [Mycena albidolilacea]
MPSPTSTIAHMHIIPPPLPHLTSARLLTPAARYDNESRLNSLVPIVRNKRGVHRVPGYAPAFLPPSFHHTHKPQRAPRGSSPDSPDAPFPKTQAPKKRIYGAHGVGPAWNRNTCPRCSGRHRTERERFVSRGARARDGNPALAPPHSACAPFVLASSLGLTSAATAPTSKNPAERVSSTSSPALRTTSPPQPRFARALKWGLAYRTGSRAYFDARISPISPRCTGRAVCTDLWLRAVLGRARSIGTPREVGGDGIPRTGPGFTYVHPSCAYRASAIHFFTPAQIVHRIFEQVRNKKTNTA